jgi:hypothetical protein
MDLARELREQIRAYVERQTTLADLREWLDAHAEVIENSDDPAVVELSENAWILFAERDRGHRDEEHLRAELGRLLPAPIALVAGWDSTARTEARTARVEVISHFEPSPPQFGPREVPLIRFPVAP